MLGSKIPRKVDSVHPTDEIALKLNKARKFGAGNYINYDAETMNLGRVVGSRRKRDIVRKNAFMSQAAFDDWNEKHGGKYVMTKKDIDGDGDEYPELVVMNPDGKLVAVNGYTFKRSDWGVREPYYTKYPMRADRKGQRIGDFVRTEIYHETPEDFDKYHYPTDEYLERLNNIQKQKEYAGYSLHASKPSAYNIFFNVFVKEPYDELLTLYGDSEEGKKTIRQLCSKEYGKQWLMKIASDKWDEWVKLPILRRISDLGGLLAYYNENHKHQAENADDPKFRDWIFSKSEMKNEVKKALQRLIDNKETYYEHMRTLIDQEIVAALPPEMSSAQSSGISSAPTSPNAKY